MAECITKPGLDTKQIGILEAGRCKAERMRIGDVICATVCAWLRCSVCYLKQRPLPRSFVYDLSVEGDFEQGAGSDFVELKACQFFGGGWYTAFNSQVSHLFCFGWVGSVYNVRVFLLYGRVPFRRQRV